MLKKNQGKEKKIPASKDNSTTSRYWPFCCTEETLLLLLLAEVRGVCMRKIVSIVAAASCCCDALFVCLGFAASCSSCLWYPCLLLIAIPSSWLVDCPAVAECRRRSRTSTHPTHLAPPLACVNGTNSNLPHKQPGHRRKQSAVHQSEGILSTQPLIIDLYTPQCYTMLQL